MIRKKSECSPTEWADILRKNRDYAKRCSPETKERMKASSRKFLLNNPGYLKSRRPTKDDDPLRYAASLAEKRAYHASKRDDPAYRAKQAIRDARRATRVGRYTPRPRKPSLVAIRDNKPRENPTFRNELFRQIWALLPNCQGRDDMASEAFIALLTGEAATPALAVKHGRKAYYKMFTQFGAPMSLDAVSPWTGLSGHETISDEMVAS